MIFDIQRHLGGVDRSVADLEKDGNPARSVILSRSYDTDIDDLWGALTRPERIPRWFLPVEGELRLGGRFKFTGNASGEITQCEPPEHLSTTWEMQGDVSWVVVGLAAEGESRARLTLTHTATVSPFWDQFGPGAVGVGWELGLLGMALYLLDPEVPKIDEEAFAKSSGGKAFINQSAKGWGDVDVARGEDPAVARAAAERTANFYTGAPPQPD
ncbi:SRPBCC family protein [Sphingomonas sp.]|uniref:SRPBCC family protein n=1 Tax=Sphingomonas sp. TaxID=28214 RepID=UPI00182DB35E|nr:SRPBCC family protein [Sphingomonas sp.]MBA3510651.1 SRPBCC family protein [Sphingomonas sp.]